MYTVSAKTTQLTMASGAAIVPSSPANTDVSSLLSTFVNNTRKTTVYIESQLLTFANLPLTAWTPSPTGDYAATLMPGMLAPVSGGSFAILGLQQIGPNSPIGVSGKRLRIAPNTANATFISTGAASGLTVSLNQPFLVDAFPPTPDPDGSGNDLWSVITVNGEAGILSVAPGAYQLQPSATADPIAGEAATVTIATVEGATTALTLGADLSRIYDASTVTVNANAVLATARRDDAGDSGLGRRDQSGARVPVEAVAAHVYGSGQLQRRAVHAAGASQQPAVERGAQLPVIGSERSRLCHHTEFDRRPHGAIRQWYSGIAHAHRPSEHSGPLSGRHRRWQAMLAAGQLTQALDRPQGLQSVTNPGIATGGADPATPAEARQSAPLPTLTLGRVVTAGGLPELRVEYSGYFAGIGHLDVVRQHARHISHRGRRGRRDLVAYGPSGGEPVPGDCQLQLALRSGSHRLVCSRAV